MKRYLHKIRSRKKEFFEKSDVFIEILKNATFTRKEIIKHLNISISTKKWRRILHDIQKRKQGNKSLDPDLKNRIKEWCESIDDDTIIRQTVQTVSRMQDKKEVYIKENKLAVVCCFKCLYGAFIKDPSNKKYENLSYVSFIRRIPKNVILPVKKTDLCELCVFAKKIETKNIKTEEEDNLLLLYRNHLENAKAQRNALKTDIQIIKDNQAIVILDFKQNIKLGGSPEELSRDYYHTTSINYLTIFVKTLNFGIFFDFTSMELTKDSYFVIECFKMLFEHPQFKNFNIDNIIVWSDVGKHFRNGMLAHFFANLPKTHQISVVHNFFVEAHGENICDVHFSQVKFKIFFN